GQRRPIHLAFREIATQVAGNPELRTIEFGITVTALIDFEGIVELAEMLAAFAVRMAGVPAMRGRLSVEIALAKHWAAARLDDTRVHRPVGRRGFSGISQPRSQKKKRNNQTSSSHMDLLCLKFMTYFIGRRAAQNQANPPGRRIEINRDSSAHLSDLALPC